MEFKITKKSKKRAKLRRARSETKLKAYKLLAYLFAFEAIAGGAGYAYMSYSFNKPLATTALIVCTLATVLLIVTAGIIFHFTSKWITTRLNEKIWISDGVLYQKFQPSFENGKRRTDDSGYEFDIYINTIKDAAFDSKSRRIEFTASGEMKHFSDYKQDVVDKTEPFALRRFIFYEYTKPRLKDTLQEMGVDFEQRRLSYNSKDATL